MARVQLTTCRLVFNQSQTCINFMNLKHLASNVFFGIYRRHIVWGRWVTRGVLRVKINTFDAELNPICLLLTLFGAHYISHVSRLRLSCFAVYSAVNVDKVRESNCYIIYIKTVFSNNCRSKIIWSYNFFRWCLINWKYFEDRVWWIMNVWRSIMNPKQYCCVPGCRGSSSRTKLKFFRLPSNPAR
jgi:hypothetical protein